MKKVIKFGASWCSQCKMQSKEMPKIKCEYQEYDVDEDEDITDKYNVMSLPTIIILEDDKEIKRFVGFTQASEINSVC